MESIYYSHCWKNKKFPKSIGRIHVWHNLPLFSSLFAWSLIRSWSWLKWCIVPEAISTNDAKSTSGSLSCAMSAVLTLMCYTSIIIWVWLDNQGEHRNIFLEEIHDDNHYKKTLFILIDHGFEPLLPTVNKCFEVLWNKHPRWPSNSTIGRQE